MTRLATERTGVIAQLAEIFREHGYAGTSLSTITGRTGLGKGSLYHLFPGGKAEMAEAVLEIASDWFEANIFRQLEAADDSGGAIDRMFDAVDRHFCSGQQACLVAAMVLDSSRDPFASYVSACFERWSTALSGALQRSGFPPRDAERLSYEVVGGIQGAIMLSRVLNQTGIFSDSTASLKSRCRV